MEKKLFSSKVLILYIVRTLIKNWANINKIVGSENGLVKSYNYLKILKVRLILDMKLTTNQNSMKKQFHWIIVICSSLYLFLFACIERTYLVDIQKIETNLFLVIISQTLFIYFVIISNIKRIEFVQYVKWIIAINIKGLANI